jgi:hypothetical protein
MNYDEVDFNPNDIWDTDFYEAASMVPLSTVEVTEELPF